jgi:hypothetical protein
LLPSEDSPVTIETAESLARHWHPGHVLTADDLEAVQVIRERDRLRWLAGMLDRPLVRAGERKAGLPQTGSGI